MENNPSDPETEDTLSLDTKVEFEAWLDKLRPRESIRGSQPKSPASDLPTADFVVFCKQGNCAISFAGVLQIEGFLSGTIRSESGTIVTGSGLIDGNLDVASAHVDGSVIGNIRATERVVLYSEAKVAGNITTPALSTKPGALFEGECFLQEILDPPLIRLNTDSATEFVEQV